MKWFFHGDNGMGMAGKEWAAALADVENLGVMTALGQRIYRNCIKEAGQTPEERFNGTIMAFAHLLHHMLDNIDDQMWADLRWSLEEEWKLYDRTLWENPEQMLRAHAALSSATPRPIMLELERLGHDLLVLVRPELYRLVWAMLVADGRKMDPRGLEGTDPSGQSLLVPLSLLDRLMADGIPQFLDDEEAAGLWELTKALDIGSGDGVASDEIMQAALGRSFMIEGQKARLDLYMHSKDGVLLDGKKISAWRMELAQVSAVLLAFRVMFIASVIGESGGLEVNLGTGVLR